MQNINVALPQELVHTDLVQWIPVSFVSDIAFIFHISDLLREKYLHTDGVKNAFFCRFQWLTNSPRSSFSTILYFSIFKDNQVESHSEILWGMVEKVQTIFLKLMGRTSQAQALQNSSNCHFTVREWDLFKSHFKKE